MTTGSMVLVRRVLSETTNHRLFRPKGEYALMRIKGAPLYRLGLANISRLDLDRRFEPVHANSLALKVSHNRRGV